MRKLILLIGAAAMTAAAPAVAKPGGGGKAKASASVKKGGARARVDARTSVRSGGKARTDSRASVRARTRTDASIVRTRDSDGDGIPDHRDADPRGGRWVMEDGRWVRVADHGRTSHPQGCPPGLAGRNPPCVPPGQARHAWRQGQIVPMSYRDYLGYDDLLARLPVAYRDDVPAGYRYIYRDNVVYVVDPATRLIRNVIDILD